MAAPLLARGAPFLHPLQHRQLAGALTRRLSFTATVCTPPEKMCLAVQAGSQLRTEERSSTDKGAEDPDYRRWKDKEEEILKDIRPITLLVKEIIHSSRYMDGERLTLKDEKIVIEKLLAYHPHCDDKIGCGLDSIMVDQHPQFRQSRCLFVLRIDGGWIDFSYQKCIRAYIRHKYPSYAERFIKEHYKRSSG